MPKPLTAHVKAFARAAHVLGGVAQLSDYLKVPQHELMRWLKGEASPPTSAFLAVVDLLAEADPKAFAASKSIRQRPKPE